MQSRKGKGEPQLNFWRKRLAQYVRSKREDADKKQKQLSVDKNTVYAIENETANPTLSTLIKIITALDGDVSEAFNSPVPKAFRGPDQDLYQMVSDIVAAGNPQALDRARWALTSLAEQIAREKSA